MQKRNNSRPMLYFGYGSNLDEEDWIRWCRQRGFKHNGLKEIGPACIDGFVLDFNYFSMTRGAGAANLRFLGSGRAATPGALFEIDEYTRGVLDKKEGHPNPKYYRRERVTVFTPDGQSHEAYTYIHHTREKSFHPPNEEYENLIRNGLNRLELPTNWLDGAIREIPKPKFDLVFVYGTLMKGMLRHSVLEQDCEFICKGSVQGELYDLGNYPGLVAGEKTVYGEVYQAEDMLDVIQKLDLIEGSGGSDPLFSRTIQKVNTEQGEKWAYVYHYAQSLDSCIEIESGNWKDVSQ